MIICQVLSDSEAGCTDLGSGVNDVRIDLERRKRSPAPQLEAIVPAASSRFDPP